MTYFSPTPRASETHWPTRLGGHLNFISTQQNSHILAETKVEGSL